MDGNVRHINPSRSANGSEPTLRADPSDRPKVSVPPVDNGGANIFENWLKRIGSQAQKLWASSKDIAGAAWTGAKKGAHFSAPAAGLYVARAGQATYENLYDKAKDAGMRAERFFREDPSYVRHRGLSADDRRRMDLEWLAARQTYRNEMHRIDQLELQRRNDTLVHRQNQAQIAPYMKLANARIMVLQALEQQRQAASQKMEAAQGAFDQARENYDNLRRQTWFWEFGMRSRAKKEFRKARDIYTQAHNEFNKEERRIEKASRPGLFGGRLFGRRLRNQALRVRDQARLTYEKNDLAYEVQNKFKRHQIAQEKLTAKRQKKAMRRTHGDARAQARHGRYENLWYDTKGFANQAGNFAAEKGLKTAATATRGAAHIGSVFVAAGLGVFGAAYGAKQEVSKALKNKRAAPTAPNP